MSDNNYLSKLNNKQLLAVTSDLCSTLVVAGAGSGKTAVLVYRIVHLVKEIGFDPKRILAFTFTNKAATEMKNRITSIIDNFQFNWIGTFHSICLRVLREEVQYTNRYSNFTIVDEDDQLSIVREIYNRCGIDKNILSATNCLYFVSALKNNRIPVNDCADEIKNFLENDIGNKKANVIERVYLEYENYLKENNHFDFDDLIIYTLHIFKNNPNILEKWQNKFDYILVDEFQDTNYDQYELIKLLSKEKTNILVVGDPDQMIYSWRGAYKEIFKEFVEDFKDVYTVILDKNYRSTKNILDVSNSLIKNNGNRIDKELYTDNKAGTKVLYFNASTQDRESRWVLEKIKMLVNGNVYTYNDIAILYRSNFVSRNIEQELIKANIPYFIFGGFKFYQRKEVKDILAYMKLICNNDELSLSRIYNTPRRKISEATFTKLKELAYKKNITTFEAFDFLDEIDINNSTKNACIEFKNLINEFKERKFKSLTDLFDYILEKTLYKQMLIDQEEKNRLENLIELKSAINQFEFKNPNSTINEYLQEIALYTSLDESNEKTKNNVVLMTVHLAKGLEFKNVFIIQFNEGIFPSQKSIDSNDISEERRIAYVAMTRAKENLFLTSSDGATFNSDSKIIKTPSRFFYEIKNNPNVEIINESYKRITGTENNSWFNSSEKIKYDDFYHKEDKEFNLGDAIIHSTFGSGVIVGIKNDVLDIVFKHPYGTKSILKNHKSIIRKLS
ncbi:ATP-dependent helicase [Malacoplasma muris]|uniref:ATP-dependent helicase n=1 Tax=Malacoplasma muris TaxID=2119 RepID=UPI00398F57DC